jgi:hypothetical protein
MSREKKEKMGFFASLVEVNPKSEKKPVGKNPPPATSPQYQHQHVGTVQYQHPQYIPMDGVGVPQMSPQMVQAPIDTSVFDKHIEELLTADKKGIDVFELLQSVNSLISTGFPEVQAYQGSFITLQTMGMTKEKLINSCKRNMELIANDRDNFTSEIQKAIEGDLTEKQGKMKVLSNQIAELEAQAQTLRVELSTTNSELQQNQTDLNGKKQGFDISAAKYTALYQSAQTKIENYIL